MKIKKPSIARDIILILVICFSQIAFAGNPELTKSIKISDYKQLYKLHLKLQSNPTQAQAQSGLYQAEQAWLRRMVIRSSVSGQHDTLSEYAKKCDAATGIHVPQFSCENGREVPGQGTIPASGGNATHCDQPNVLNGQCDPGSKFQVLPGRSADAVAVAHCRKVGLPINGNLYNDIAVIQYNKKNGALCFYQALTNLPGQDIPQPTDGEGAKWKDNQPHWKSPEGTEGIGCTGCHDNGGFIRSEYLAQLQLPGHLLPNTSDGFNNLNIPVRYVGLDYATNKSWSINTSLSPNDPGMSCTSCHRLAVPNRMAFGIINGTAANFANIATAASQKSKNPHGPTSPIWMRLGQTFYNPEVESSATKYKKCATDFFNSGFTSSPSGCSTSPLGLPWIDKAWQSFELTPASSSSTGSWITAVSRIPGSMEIWWIASNGSVQGAFWYENSQWKRYELASAGSASISGGITAVSRIPGSMEVWWVGANGSVQDAFWYDNSTWQRFELAPAGSAATNGGITAVSRIPGSMEVWWVGANGSVQDAFWYDNSTWQRFELAPAGSAATSGGITGISRIPGSLEVWWVGANGSVQDAFWYDNSTWQRFELAPAGSAATNGGITAVSRIPGSLEVWWVGSNGSVQDAFWYDNSTWQRFELAPANSAATNGGITAVSRIPGSLEVWWVGANGSVQDAFWYDNSTWQRFELAPAGSAATVGSITAVSRVPGSMEVWWIGANGSIKDAFWYD
jgi:hypothetical protein